MQVQDGDSVRILRGEYKGQIGKFVGQPGMLGVGVKLPTSKEVVSVPFEPGARTLDKLIELFSPPLPTDTIGGAPQPA